MEILAGAGFTKLLLSVNAALVGVIIFYGKSIIGRVNVHIKEDSDKRVDLVMNYVRKDDMTKSLDKVHHSLEKLSDKIDKIRRE